MPLNTIRGADYHYDQNLSAKTMSIPAGTVDDEDVASNAAISPTKLQHFHTGKLAQETSANASAETRVVHVAQNDGTVYDLMVGLVTPPDTASGSGGRTAVVDLLKNGVSILSATITLNSTSTAYAITNGTFSASSYVAGDVFSLAVTLGAGSTGTYPKGIFAVAVFCEKGQ